MFQFQYGAIWRTIQCSPSLTGLRFQFQYGAIWSQGIVGKLALIPMFQFQYGAIWSHPSFPKGVQGIVFQFQYGAIWRAAPLTSKPNFFSFNSSMVRFGGCPEGGIIYDPFSFNSSMVRFGDQKRRTEGVLNAVSIPVWCDLEWNL